MLNLVLFEEVSCWHILLLIFRFVLQHGGRALIADEMGLGKTIQVSKWWLNIIHREPYEFVKNCALRSYSILLFTSPDAELGASLSFSNSINASIVFILQNLSCRCGCVMVTKRLSWLMWMVCGYCGLYFSCDMLKNLYNMVVTRGYGWYFALCLSCIYADGPWWRVSGLTFVS